MDDPPNHVPPIDETFVRFLISKNFGFRSLVDNRLFVDARLFVDDNAPANPPYGDRPGPLPVVL